MTSHPLVQLIRADTAAARRETALALGSFALDRVLRIQYQVGRSARLLWLEQRWAMCCPARPGSCHRSSSRRGPHRGQHECSSEDHTAWAQRKVQCKDTDLLLQPDSIFVFYGDIRYPKAGDGSATKQYQTFDVRHLLSQGRLRARIC